MNLHFLDVHTAYVCTYVCATVLLMIEKKCLVTKYTLLKLFFILFQWSSTNEYKYVYKKNHIAPKSDAIE